MFSHETETICRQRAGEILFMHIASISNLRPQRRFHSHQSTAQRGETMRQPTQASGRLSGAGSTNETTAKKGSWLTFAFLVIIFCGAALAQGQNGLLVQTPQFHFRHSPLLTQVPKTWNTPDVIVISPDERYRVKISYQGPTAVASCYSIHSQFAKLMSDEIDRAPTPMIDAQKSLPILVPVKGGLEYRIQHTTGRTPPILESTICSRGRNGFEAVDILAGVGSGDMDAKMYEMFTSIAESLRFEAAPVLEGQWVAERSEWVFRGTGSNAGTWTSSPRSGFGGGLGVTIRGAYRVLNTTKVDAGEEGQIEVTCQPLKGGRMVPPRACHYTLGAGKLTLNCPIGGCFLETTAMTLP